MQKNLKFLYLFYLVGSFNACTSQQKLHLRQLKESFPYGLVGDDYGILNKDDLAINTCEVEEVVPFPPQDVSSYPYWQCYSVKDVAIRCDDSDFDEDVQSTMAILDFQVRSQKGNHDYLTRRAIPMESCKYFQIEFKKMTENEQHVCASGDFWKKDAGSKLDHATTWSFDKFKTKKGCVSYFADECDLKVQVANGCKPISSSIFR